MMADYDLGARIIDETMADLLPGKFDTSEARTMLLAIGIQESLFEYRNQVRGPARGYWMFERGGGCYGVFHYPTTAQYAKSFCVARGVHPSYRAAYHAIAKDEVLACALARLLLWTDPYELPDTASAAWRCYTRVWRPGKPHPEPWPERFEKAWATVHETV